MVNHVHRFLSNLCSPLMLQLPKRHQHNLIPLQFMLDSLTKYWIVSEKKRKKKKTFLLMTQVRERGRDRDTSQIKREFWFFRFVGFFGLALKYEFFDVYKIARKHGCGSRGSRTRTRHARTRYAVVDAVARASVVSPFFFFSFFDLGRNTCLKK